MVDSWLFMIIHDYSTTQVSNCYSGRMIRRAAEEPPNVGRGLWEAPILLGDGIDMDWIMS